MSKQKYPVENEKKMSSSHPLELEYTYWEDGDGWLIGYLNIWPEHWTQGKGIQELEEMLVDLYGFYKEEKTKKHGERKTGKLRVTA